MEIWYSRPFSIAVGVNDKGQVLQDKAPEKWQHDITAWGNGCFPELPVIPRTLHAKDGKEFLAVVVPLSETRPHFARPAFRRQGAKTIPAGQIEIDQWIAYRSSKVRLILEQKHSGRKVVLQPITDGFRSSMFGTPAGTYEVKECNSHYVTIRDISTDALFSEPLSQIELTWNHKQGCLTLLLKPILAG